MNDLKLWVGQACEDEHARLMARYDVSPKALRAMKRLLGIGEKPKRAKRRVLCANCRALTT